MKFDQLGLDDRLVKSLNEKFGYYSPTEIQKKAVPAIIKGKHVLGIAPSGTGKTIAYLAPVIHNIVRKPVEHNNPLALILSPTRELARQIEGEAEKLGEFVALNSVGIISHRPFNKIQAKMKEPVDIIIATPLKLKEYIEKGLVDLSKIQHFVLDECDRLLEMGFYDDIMEIYDIFKKNKECKTHLFSATLPKDMEKLANDMMKSPHKIEIARLKTSNRLKQNIFEVTKGEKLDVLADLLRDPSITSAIVFCRTKDAVRVVANHLLKEGLELEEIHGGLTDKQRMKALINFDHGIVQVLVASDLISRGINIPEVSHVINFDLPNVIEDYVHRVGRTARAGRPGTAWTLVTPEDFHNVARYEKLIGTKFHRSRKLPDHLRVSNYELKKKKKKADARVQREKERKQKLEERRKKRTFNPGWNYRKEKKPPTNRKRRR